MAGRIVVLNGTPRSGKTSIARRMQAYSEDVWLNHGVDQSMRDTPQKYQPGIGLRPGGERPDLEPLVVKFYLAHYDALVELAREGYNLVADLGHHDAYSKPLHILEQCAQRLDGIEAWLIGVDCDLTTILARRAEADGIYARPSADDPVPAPVLRWQEEVHRPGIYDLRVDTTRRTSEDCAREILDFVASGRPSTAFTELARRPV